MKTFLSSLGNVLSPVAHDHKIELFLSPVESTAVGESTRMRNFLSVCRVNAQQKITLSSGRGCFIWLGCIRKQNQRSLLVCTDPFVSFGLS
jgi:hypothetical protein